jgi:hypothetical protein
MPVLRVDRIAAPPRPLLSGDGRVLAARCYAARTVLARTVGLLGTARLEPDEALWIAPCRGVHTWGLRVPMGCALLDAEGRVLAVRDPLPRWRTARAPGARAVVEASPGVLAGLRAGEVLRLGG